LSQLAGEAALQALLLKALLGAHLIPLTPQRFGALLEVESRQFAITMIV